jgi:hypothetical protein
MGFDDVSSSPPEADAPVGAVARVTVQYGGVVGGTVVGRTDSRASARRARSTWFPELR